MPVKKDLLNLLANWFTICGAICLTMYESMLSNPVDLFDLLWRIILLISAGVVGEQNKLSGFDSISSIGSLSVCGKFAASVFPRVVKYVLKLFAMSVLSVQGTPLDVIHVSVTAVFLFLFFSISPIVSHVFSHYFYARQIFLWSNFSLQFWLCGLVYFWTFLYVISLSCVGVFFSFFIKIILLYSRY